MATMVAHVCDDVLMYGKLKVVLKRWGVPSGKQKIKKKNLLHRVWNSFTVADLGNFGNEEKPLGEKQKQPLSTEI